MALRREPSTISTEDRTNSGSGIDLLTIYRWPQYNYDAATAKLAVTFILFLMHEAIVSTLLRKFILQFQPIPLQFTCLKEF